MKLLSGKIYISGFLIVLIVAFCLMAAGWNGSLLEMYGFRQTQTAISVLYMLKGGSLVNYQTPVLGPPWTIPLEFPFYQIVVFLLVKLTGYSIDQSGRLVSVFFFLSLLYPAYFLARPFFADRSKSFIFLILLCVSPQYIYWSRTFMIESAALSLSVWYLYFVRQYLDIDEASRFRVLVLASVFTVGVLAAVTKVTTFFVYYLIGFIFMLMQVWEANKKQKLSNILRGRSLLTIVAFVLPLIAIVVWTSYSDHIKGLSAYGAGLASAGLKKWNFGTMAKKLSANTWGTILGRSASDLFGNIWLSLLIILPLPFCRKRTVMTVFSLLLLYVVPMAVFTNLFFVHTYYIYANGILLILALAIVLGDLSERGMIGNGCCIIATFTLLYFSYSHYVRNYLPVQGVTYRFEDIKQDIDRYTNPDDVLVVAGGDWSSEMPYYLQRRALMIKRDRRDSPRFQIAKSSLAGYAVGSIAVCSEARNNPEVAKEMLFDFWGSSSEVWKMSYATCDFYFRNSGKS